MDAASGEVAHLDASGRSLGCGLSTTADASAIYAGASMQRTW
jgi:hypothetical protein